MKFLLNSSSLIFMKLIFSLKSNKKKLHHYYYFNTYVIKGKKLFN